MNSPDMRIPSNSYRLGLRHAYRDFPHRCNPRAQTALKLCQHIQPMSLDTCQLSLDMKSLRFEICLNRSRLQILISLIHLRLACLI